MKFGFGFNLGSGTGGGVVSDVIFWLTNVRNLVTTTGSGPAVFDRGDSSVTVQAYGGLATTPINGIGSPGMRISYDTDEVGVVLGAEEVVNGDFATDVSDWSASNGAISHDTIIFADGGLKAAMSSAFGGGYQLVTLPQAGKYRVSADINIGTSNEGRIYVGTGAPGQVQFLLASGLATGTHTFDIDIDDTTINIDIRGGATVGNIYTDNVSIKLITPVWLNSASKADATLLTPVKVVEGADVYINVSKWADATLYAAGSYATDFDGVQNKYYLTALGGTSNGTGVADDIGVTDWVEQGNYVNTNEQPGIASNPAFTQYFVLPEAPVTQTISLGTGNFTLFVWGSDGASVAANTATGTGFGAATLNTPITINITGAGTVDVTVTGTPLFVGLHNSEFTAVSVLNPTTTVAVAASSETSPQVFSDQFIRCRATGGLYAETLYSDGTNVLAWDGTDLTFTDGVATLTAAAVGLIPNDDIVVDTTDGKLYVNGVLKDTDGTLAVTWGAITIIGNISDLAESSSFDPTDQDWKAL